MGKKSSISLFPFILLTLIRDSTAELHGQPTNPPQSQPDNHNALLRTFGLQIFSLKLMLTSISGDRWPW